MSLVRVRLKRSGRSLGSFKLLLGWTERLRGLLGTTRDARQVILCPCSSIHSFGMRYPLDVALVGKAGTVLRSERRLVPGRVVGCRQACLVMERPARGGPWPDVGEVLAFEDNGKTWAPAGAERRVR
ncbi:hypothetical protein [Olsenella sp. HMSC062G07]|uniref:hypothetical protein n=1 Tax=Olsenella sp. HMSC062G07 TaxID=1739330 RepID=UPI0008A25F3D|nr:hypothetical protein [Olsenella sp. HMSC062G07]OFK23453.1 hypothetical protein HMPREF2826_05080 [Olsenella sp. HMSC062G07]